MLRIQNCVAISRGIEISAACPDAKHFSSDSVHLMQTTASESLLVTDAINGGMNHGNTEKENA
jgi:hypothetical protein